MRKHLLYLVLIPATLALLTATPVVAQELLPYPVSARVISMGQTGAADNSSPSTIFLNPANVLGAPRLYAQGMMVTTNVNSTDYWIQRANAGSTWKMGSAVTLGFDLSYAKLHHRNDTVYSNHQLDEDMLGLAAGVGLVSGTNDFLLGVAVKSYTRNSEWRDNTEMYSMSQNEDANAIDAGFEVRNRATLQGWDINSAMGAAVVNAGPDTDNQFNAGLNVRMVSPPVEVLSAHVPLIAFCASFDAALPDEGEWVWMVGTELSVAQMLFLRSGIQTYTGSENPDPSLATWGAGVGIPISRLRARLDYGRRGEYYGKFEHYEFTLEWTL